MLAAERLKEIAEADEKGQRAKVLLGTRREPAEGLRAFAAKHLVKKAKGGKVTTRWLEQTERQLEAAVAFFGVHRALASIEVADVPEYKNDFPEQAGRYVQSASGYDYTLVNGKVFMENGQPTGTLAGTMLRA